MAEDELPGVSLWRGAFRRLRRNPSAIVGRDHRPDLRRWSRSSRRCSRRTSPAPRSGRVRSRPRSVPGPSEDHWLGLDRFGSDMWTQMVYGARQSLVVRRRVHRHRPGRRRRPRRVAGGFGAVGGRFGGWVDTSIMRLVDIMLSIPSLLLAVSIAAVLGQNAVLGDDRHRRRPRCRSSRGCCAGRCWARARADYVLAAGALGIRKRRIVMGHVLPNSIGPDDRAGHAQPRHRDHRGRGAVLPRARRRPTRRSRSGAGCSSRPRTGSTSPHGWPSCRASRSPSRRSASPCSVRRCARPSTPGSRR